MPAATAGAPGVRACNALTERWAAALDHGPAVIAGAGVWPLLGLLADGATAPARQEIEAAVGLEASAAMDAAHRLLGVVHAAPGCGAALAILARPSARLDPAWARRAGAGVRTLTDDVRADQAEADAWARRETRGLVDRFPMALDRDLELALASAIACELTWLLPFAVQERAHVAAPWAALGPVPHLVGGAAGGCRAEVADTAVGVITLVTVPSRESVDVVIAVADLGRPASQVLPAALTALGDGNTRDAATLRVGATAPCLSVGFDETLHTDRLEVDLAPFDIRTGHDLLRTPELFGLSTASDCTRGHFPGIAREPLCVRAAAQAAVAQFASGGFCAAAVSAVVMPRASVLRPSDAARGAKLVSVTVDRPFGFAVRQGTTGLVLVAGWVTTPRLPFED